MSKSKPTIPTTLPQSGGAFVLADGELTPDRPAPEAATKTPERKAPASKPTKEA